LCPICNAPGFQLAERVPGLPCEDCGTHPAAHTGATLVASTNSNDLSRSPSTSRAAPSWKT
ncbi:MAG: hypothetical protein ACP5EP_11695, partial [Acidobacteriaceae bacterium]